MHTDETPTFLYEFQAGDSPLLIDVPHAGTELPAQLAVGMDAPARQLVDTDWHVHRLVEFAPDLGASLLCARLSRYVIDLNRGADDQPLYAGPTTGLVPTESFDGEPVYRSDPPDAGEIRRRIEHYWEPYHARLQGALDAIRQRHGFAVLLDAHSIRSRVPRLFEGRLPDLNLGTFDGRSCDLSLQQSVVDLLAANKRFSHVVNGRFKGGYITRHYGRPGEGVHALQLEIAQDCYMDEASPQTWDPARAGPLQRLLRQLADLLIEWRPA